MGIFDFFQKKESVTRRAMVIGQVGTAKHTGRNYKAMADEGFKTNVVVYRSISLVAQAAAQVQWELYKKSASGKEEVTENPLLDLLKNPNPMVGQKQFFEALIAYLLSSGNTYIELNNQANLELWNVRPDYMKVIPGALGLPAAYEFQAGTSGETRIFPVDQITGRSAICHMKLFNPTDNWYGMSPLEAAFLSIDQHNNAGRWNLSLLQRDARPSGALMVEMSETNPSGKLTDEQFNNMKAQIDDLYSGAKNAGRPMLLEGGLSWQQMSSTVKDMDWLNAKNLSAREIALAMGVPPLLLNISGDNTYSNMKEARLAFYEETVIPLLCFVRDELNRWLTPLFGEDLELDFNVDTIDAMIAKRQMKMEAANAGREFLTINERRDLVGYEPIEGGDVLQFGPEPIEPFDDSSDDANDPEVDEEESDDNGQSGSEGQGDDAPQDEEQDSEKFHDISLFDEIKAVNLITKREKKLAARAMVRKRDSLAVSMELDLQDVFDSINKKIGKITSTQPKLAEMQAAAIIADHKDDLDKVFKKHLKRAAMEFARPILQSRKSLNPSAETKNEEWFNSWLSSFIESHTAQNVSYIQGTTTKKAREKIKVIIESGMRDGESNVEIGKQLQEELEGLSAGRARTIARTEVAIASQNGSLKAAEALEIPGLMKEWVSIQDDRTRDGESSGEADHLSMDGVKVGLDDLFAVYIEGDSPTLMTGPGDPSAPASQLINCRCALVYVAPRG
jgi:HK97 family phage portal protein